jgi:Zn-dependent protease with chaperone function
MALSLKTFDALVARVDRYAQAHPARYRRRLLLLALLGYGYIGVLLLALLAGALASFVVLKGFALKLVIPVAAFVGLVLKALWVRIEAPAGIALARADAPELWALLDRLRAALRAPRFHRVVVSDDFNAAVVQVPRLGLFGWHRNELVLGLPLLKALTPAQLEAVLAHELGHLAGGHAARGNRYYRLRLGWARLHEAMTATRHWGSFAVRPFFDWYAPYFAAYAFPLARMQEYEADATSAALTSTRAVAEALTSVSVVGSYLGEQYWPQIHQQADHQPQPAFAPYAELGRGLHDAIRPEHATVWLERALAQATSSADTHPSLRDRLRAIGERPRLAFPRSGETADRLLGAARERITAALDERWHATIAQPWAERHRTVQERRARLGELGDRLDRGETLPVELELEYAQLDEEHGAGPDVALARLRALHARAPAHAAVCFALATRLLPRESATATVLFERAMVLDQDAIAPACQLLRDWHLAQGRAEEAYRWDERLAQRARLDDAAAAERAEVRPRDRFLPHELDAAALARLRDSLRAIDGIHRAWLVRKRIKLRPDRPLYVLGYTCHRPLALYRPQRVERLTERILREAVLPGETLVLCTDGDNYPFRRKLRRVRRARLL